MQSNEPRALLGVCIRVIKLNKKRIKENPCQLSNGHSSEITQRSNWAIPSLHLGKIHIPFPKRAPTSLLHYPSEVTTSTIPRQDSQRRQVMEYSRQECENLSLLLSSHFPESPWHFHSAPVPYQAVIFLLFFFSQEKFCIFLQNVYCLSIF